MRVSGYMNHYKIVLSAGAIKNRDKLIDPNVRIIARYLLLIHSDMELAKSSLLFVKL